MGEAFNKLADILEQRLTNNRASPSNDYRGIQLQPYEENVESSESYMQRLENYIELRGLNEESDSSTCVKILINCVGPKLYQTLLCLTAPDKPNTKTFAELKKLLKEYFCPIPNEISEQHKFSMRLQHEGETIAQYQAELKRLSINCNFNCLNCNKSTVLTHLRSQFIRGVRDDDIRQRLLQQDARKTFDDAVQLVLSIEASKLESRGMRNELTGAAVNKIDYKKNISKNKSSKTSSQNMQLGKCFRCGRTNHKANNCRARNLKCFKCNRLGHIGSVCMSTKPVNQSAIAEDSPIDEASSDNDSLPMFHLVDCNFLGDNEILLDIYIENKICRMEMDTGAAASTISLKDFQNLCPTAKISETKIKLKTYTSEIIRPLGSCKVKISYRNMSHYSNIYIFKQNVSPIFGRDLIRKFKLDTMLINQLQKDITESECRDKINKLMIEYSEIFSDKIGTIPNYSCKFKLKSQDTAPIFLKPRPVPYALKSQIEEEIERLESCGIIEKVDYSPYGTPIVPVMKRNGKQRLCADYKATINSFICEDNYPISRVEDIFIKMSGGKYFCTLDIRQAYLHMMVDEESALMQTLSTHKGTYKVKRLMFGIKVAPNILQNLPASSCFFDDVVVQGASYNELLKNLKALLERLKKYDLHINKAKCQFLLQSITYLGHVIDKNGIRPMEEKIEAITNCRQPQNVSELRIYLGLFNYYQKFLPNLSTKLRPLNNLLKQGVKFIWSRECENIFKHVKNEITSARTLISYSADLPLILATDASPVGLGAVISHITPDGKERPIAFASRSLTRAESNYSQIDKEATAIVWGLQKFFQYCYGRKIILVTDHKPLTSILHPNKSLPATSATRLLHYANYISGFNYEIRYRNTKTHANADFLSRYPLQSVKYKENKNDAVAIFQINQLDTIPISGEDIKRETLKDKECQQYYIALRNGTSLPHGESLSTFSLHNGVIFNGVRVMIPTKLRGHILKELHTAHLGIVKMKAIARSYVWWRGIDQDIENVVSKCYTCRSLKPESAKVPTHFWCYPDQPWYRVHIDYAGPFMGTNFLIVVDAYTKWFEAVPTKSTSSFPTISILRDIFARFGLPIILVSDNGAQFPSEEFESFLKSNGIKHKYAAPYHPATNGQAERYVYTLKQGLRKMMAEKGDQNTKLSQFLMQYRKAPNSSTGKSPSELMFNRAIRTKIDLMTKIPNDKLEQSSPAQKTKEFKPGDKVQIRNYNSKHCKWLFGHVQQRTGKLHYDVLIDNVVHRRHVNQILHRLQF